MPGNATDFADGRGNIRLAMSINTREANCQRDRDYFRDEFASPTGSTGNVFFFRLPGSISLVATRSTAMC